MKLNCLEHGMPLKAAFNSFIRLWLPVFCLRPIRNACSAIGIVGFVQRRSLYTENIIDIS